MSTRPIKLVCFDLGGVVIRICRSWQEGCVRAGLDLRPIELNQPAWLHLVEQHQTGRMTGVDYFQQMSALLHGVYSSTEVERIHMAWTMEPYAGVHELISDLRAAGIRTCALSNTNHEHWQRITAHPELRAMDHLIASHTIGLHKPDRRAFEHVDRTMNCTGKEVVFFDDSLENIHAACAHGWHAVHIDHAGNTASQMRAALESRGAFVMPA